MYKVASYNYLIVTNEFVHIGYDTSLTLVLTTIFFSYNKWCQSDGHSQTKSKDPLQNPLSQSLQFCSSIKMLA